MVQRIQDEVIRNTSVDSVYIKKAIVTSIRHYRYHRFWFNQGGFSMVTADGDQEYTAISSGSDGYPRDLISVDRLTLTHNDSLIPLEKVGIQRLRDLDASASHEARPSHWAFHHETLILYPTPDAVYTITGDYVRELTVSDPGLGTSYAPGIEATYVSPNWTFTDMDGTALTDDCTNAWFDEAEELIRAKAKSLVYGEVLRDSKGAAEQEILAELYFRNLKLASGQFEMPDAIVPWN